MPGSICHRKKDQRRQNRVRGAKRTFNHFMVPQNKISLNYLSYIKVHLQFHSVCQWKSTKTRFAKLRWGIKSCITDKRLSRTSEKKRRIRVISNKVSKIIVSEKSLRKGNMRKEISMMKKTAQIKAQQRKRKPHSTKIEDYRNRILSCPKCSIKIILGKLKVKFC